MTTIFVDGFDEYGPVGTSTDTTTLPQGGWTLVTTWTTPFPAAPLSALGQAMTLGIGSVGYVAMSKTLPTNYSRLIGGFRFSSNLTNYAGVAFLDNATTQCGILVSPTSGFISIFQGGAGNLYANTLLQQSSASVAANTEHYLEFDVTFNSTSLGGWTVWLDGVQILGGTGTTQQSGHNYSNVLQFIGYSSTTGGNFTIDDFYLFSSASPTNNAVLLSNPVVVTQFPVADHQTQLSNVGNVFGNTIYINNNRITLNANTLYLTPFVPTVNCTITDVVILPWLTVGGANIKGCIYANSGSAPGALIEGGTQVTGTVTETLLELPLAASAALTAGTTYWLGLVTDTNITIGTAFGTAVGSTASLTYSSAFPGTAPSMTLTGDVIVLFGACTGVTTNWESMSVNPPVGDLSSVQSTTVNNEDLYIFPVVPTNITNVYTVAVSANAKLTASGSHTFNLVASSSGTSSNGTNSGINPTLSYTWYDSYFDVDPHTGNAWAPNAVNIGYYGMEIAS